MFNESPAGISSKTETTGFNHSEALVLPWLGSTPSRKKPRDRVEQRWPFCATPRLRRRVGCAGPVRLALRRGAGNNFCCRSPFL